MFVNSIEASTVEFSTDGSLFTVTDANGFGIYDGPSKKQKHRIECPGVQALSFSPKGTFLTTFQRPVKGVDGHAEKNLHVWDTKSGTKVLSLHQKTFSKENWPSVQFDLNETTAVHMVTNTLHVYDPKKFNDGPCFKFPVKGLAGFSLSPVRSTDSFGLVAVYIPEAKGSPGAIALYNLTENANPAPICRRSFYRANSARFSWAPTGSAVLITTASDVDATNKSYYGEQKLFFLSADGTNDTAVALPKEGPIHDVQWSPKGDYFLTVAGFMPAKTTLFTSKCVAKFDLGSGPYSMARWNPFGRFFVLAGFGNLPGDLAFFDKKADAKCKSMGTSRAENGVTLEWSPCGRYVLAATIAPRLRVDNGLQIFKYDGTLVSKERHEILYQSCWKPVPEGTFEDRPQTPRNSSSSANPAGDQTTKLPPQPTKSTGYIPPHLRNNPAAAAAARASFSLARDPEDKGGFVSKKKVAGADLPPGALPPVSKSAAKNAKRRAKKKASTATEGSEISNGMSNMKL